MNGNVTLTARWGGQAVEVTLSPADWNTVTFDEFRGLLEAETDVPANKMKLIGIVTSDGKLPKNELIKDLRFKKSDRSFMLVGTARGNFLKEPEPDDDVETAVASYDVSLAFEVLRDRMREAIKTTDLRWMNSGTRSKKLLVLDLDYTLFDCQGTRDVRIPLSAYKRPYFDSFLKEAYENFNLCVWSQTSWTWVEAKVTELGMLSSPDYNLLFVLDQSSMFTVTSSKNGSREERTHQVKALEMDRAVRCKHAEAASRAASCTGSP